MLKYSPVSPVFSFNKLLTSLKNWPNSGVSSKKSRNKKVMITHSSSTIHAFSIVERENARQGEKHCHCRRNKLEYYKYNMKLKLGLNLIRNLACFPHFVCHSIEMKSVVTHAWHKTTWNSYIISIKKCLLKILFVGPASI